MWSGDQGLKQPDEIDNILYLAGDCYRARHEGKINEAEYKAIFNSLKKRFNRFTILERIDELSHIEPIPEAEPYLRFWWGEKDGERDIAMTLSERIEELEKESKL